MSKYNIERDPTKVEQAFAVKTEGKAIGWFQTPEHAQNFIDHCHQVEAESKQDAEQQPTSDPAEKLIRSIKLLRKELMGEVGKGKEEAAEAMIDIGTTFILSLYSQSRNIERISHAIIAQTHTLAAVYSQGEDPETTRQRVVDAVEGMDTHLANMDA